MRKAILLAGFCWLISIPSGHSAFRAGIAVRTVNPDPLLPVSGGVGPSHSVTNRLGDLTVRALVFDDGSTRVGIVSVDFLGFPASLGNRVRSAVSASIKPANLLIGATHTHSAPDCYGFPDGKGGTAQDPKYISLVCSKTAEAVDEACKNLKPASLRIATGEAKGRIAYNYYAEHLYDPRCHVIQTVDESGKPFATLVNYAIHPEVLGSDRGVCSPDLIGPLYERLQEQGAGTGIFMNSAQGGMVTADTRRQNGEANTWEECQRIGRALAEEAIRIVGTAEVQQDPKILCRAERVTFPVDSPLMQQLLQHMPGVADQSGKSVTTQLNLVNLGNAQIVTIPGEALPNIGYYLKRKMRGKHNLLFGLTNDAFGYMLTKEDFDSFKRYDYITRTSLGERTGDVLVNEVLELVRANPAPQ